MFAPESIDQIDVIDSGGKDEVLRGIAIAGRSRRLRVAGVLDGDQRGPHGESGVFFLPGDTAPEALLLDALRVRADQAAAALSVAVSDLRVALDAARFVPHQRVFQAMSASLQSCTANEIWDYALVSWLQSEGVIASARELAEQLLAITAMDTSEA